MDLDRILAAMKTRGAPQLAIVRTEAKLRGQPLQFDWGPYLVIGINPAREWGPALIDDVSGFDPAAYYVLGLTGV